MRLVTYAGTEHEPAGGRTGCVGRPLTAGKSSAEIPHRNSLPPYRAAWPLTAEAQQPANLRPSGSRDRPCLQSKANNHTSSVTVTDGTNKRHPRSGCVRPAQRRERQFMASSGGAHSAL